MSKKQDENGKQQGDGAAENDLLIKAGRAARDQGVVAASGAAGAGLAVWLGGPGAATAGAITGATLGRGLLEYVKSVFSRRVERRAEAFAAETATVLMEADLGDDLQRAALDAVLFEAYRALMAALDDAVVPALARLVGLYSGGQRPDRFFRSVGRVLEQIDAEELRVLASALEHVRALSTAVPAGSPSIHCDFGVDPFGDWGIDFASAEHWAVGHRRHANTSSPAAERFGEVFQLLAREGVIARSEPVVANDAPPAAYVVPLPLLERLHGVIVGPGRDVQEQNDDPSE